MKQVQMRPSAPMAAYQVGRAAAKLPSHTNIDSVITEHCSETFQPNPKPIEHCPALTSAKENGHWLMERGRNMSVSECARVQGYLFRYYKWHHDPKHNTRIGEG